MSSHGSGTNSSTNVQVVTQQHSYLLVISGPAVMWHSFWLIKPKCLRLAWVSGQGSSGESIGCTATVSLSLSATVRNTMPAPAPTCMSVLR